MKNIGKKKNVGSGGNGILQRLGIDDVDQPTPFHNFVSTPMGRVDIKRPASYVFDVFRGANFSNLKRTSPRTDADVVGGKGDDDDVESEVSDVDRTTPNNVSGNPNPLYALKELCNNTCTTASVSTATQKRRKTTLLKSDESNGRSSSPSPSSASSTPATPKMLIECRQKDIENNVALKRPIDSECVTTDDDDDDEKATNDAKKSSSTKIRVKSDSELMRSTTSTSRSRRSRRDAAPLEEKRATSVESVTMTSQASQSAAEAKFFRYSELAKVLSAGN